MKTHLTISLANILVVCVLLFGNVHAQTPDADYHTVSGRVVDVRNQNPIAFASVFIPGTSIGTVANLDGVFTLKIRKDISATHFAISHLGYRIAQFPVQSSAGTEQAYSLQPYSVDLPEVIVRPTDPRALVATALSKIPQNYTDIPLQLTAFYREAIRQRRDYISISEAVVDIYQAPYSATLHTDRTRLVQGRKSGDVKKADTLIVKLQGGPHGILMLDIVKNPDVLLSKETMAYYDYEFIDIVKIAEASNYVIGFRPRVVLPFPLFYGKLYISVESHGITMAEFSLDLSDKDKAAQNFIIRKPLQLRFTPTNTNYLVTYKEINGRYHINYIRTEVEFFADWRRRIFRTPYHVMAEMAITDRTPDNVNRFGAREAFRPTNILADLVPVYFDEAYWGSYNVIEPEESIEAAIRRFNRRLVPDQD